MRAGSFHRSRAGDKFKIVIQVIICNERNRIQEGRQNNRRFGGLAAKKINWEAQYEEGSTRYPIKDLNARSRQALSEQTTDLSK